jgi:hypothetical protein
MEVLQPDDASPTFRMSHFYYLLLTLTVSAWMCEMEAVWECPSSTWLVMLVTCRVWDDMRWCGKYLIVPCWHLNVWGESSCSSEMCASLRGTTLPRILPVKYAVWKLLTYATWRQRDWQTVDDSGDAKSFRHFFFKASMRSSTFYFKFAAAPRNHNVPQPWRLQKDAKRNDSMLLQHVSHIFNIFQLQGIPWSYSQNMSEFYELPLKCGYSWIGKNDAPFRYI